MLGRFVMQVSRLQRELTRMEAERDRAREDARRYTSLQHMHLVNLSLLYLCIAACSTCNVYHLAPSATA